MVKRLSFYNVKSKNKVNTSNYEVITKIVKGHNKKFAIATIKGMELWRVLPNDFKK